MPIGDKAKFDSKPGQHGRTSGTRTSDFGLQLREKQKIKRIYCLQEAQFRNTFAKAENQKGVTGSNFISLLERRLDNVTYRSGFANSRSEARQLVRHGHFTINGRKVDVPSYLVKKGDLVEVHQTSREVARIRGALEAVKRREVPQWLELDSAGFSAKIRDLPAREDVTAPMQERLVVELYSK
jgi:small subunit ribosomal protein S4